MPEALEELLARYHEGELDEAGLGRLVAMLETDRSARTAYRGEMRLTALLRQAAALQREQAPRPRSASRRRWPALTLVGAALAASLVLLLLPMPGAPPPQEPAGGMVYNGRTVASGDLLVGAGELQWPDGSTLTLAAAARLRLGAGEVRGELLDGAATAQVAHQQPGAAFAIDAGRQRLTALGTRFTVAVAAGTASASVDEGVVGIGEVAAPQSSLLLFPGESWTASGTVVRSHAAAAAARQQGRAYAEPLLDLRFDEAAGSIVHDRSGRQSATPAILSPGRGSGLWSSEGLTLRQGARLDWRGDSTLIRQAIAAKALTVEIVWSCSGPVGHTVSLLEFIPDGAGTDGCSILADLSDARLHSSFVRYGPAGIEFIDDGKRRILMGGPGSASEQRLFRFSRDNLGLTMRGIATADLATKPSSYVPVCYRRLILHGRLLTLEEMRRNAYIDIADLAQR